MSRRVKLPGADELFRPTKDGDKPPGKARQLRPVDDAAPEPEQAETDNAAPDAAPEAAPEQADGKQRSSGRVRHDEKMTVYITADELFELESARLALRRDHGVAVDRGRLVREAVSIALADLADRGGDSDIADRLAAK